MKFQLGQGDQGALIGAPASCTDHLHMGGGELRGCRRRERGWVAPPGSQHGFREPQDGDERYCRDEELAEGSPCDWAAVQKCPSN